MTDGTLRAINLFVYGDSLAFRRPFQPDDFSFCYPFRLAREIESRGLGRVNLLIRSRGGALIGEMLELAERDSSYFQFNGDAHCLNVAVVQLGVVDCAPVPFTFPLRVLVGSLPRGGSILELLRLNRPLLQGLWSYSRTSEKQFSEKYSNLVGLLQRSGFLVLGITIPKPSMQAEARSPGFSDKALRYSELIMESAAIAIDVNNAALTKKSDKRDDVVEPYVLPEDGHHLTKRGHELYAELLFSAIESNI